MTPLWLLSYVLSKNKVKKSAPRAAFFKVTFLPDINLVVTKKNSALIHEKFGEVMLGRRTYLQFLYTSCNLVFLKI